MKAFRKSDPTPVEILKQLNPSFEGITRVSKTLSKQWMNVWPENGTFNLDIIKCMQVILGQAQQLQKQKKMS